MALVINSGYKSLNLYFTEPNNTYYIDDVNTSGTTQSASTAPRSDIDKLYVWIGLTSSFTADNTTLVYNGIYQNNVIIDKYNGSDLIDNTNYYIKYAIVSKLEPDLKIISSAVAGTTRDISSEVGLKPWVVVTSNYLASSGDRLIADTSAGTFTITLPLNPDVGDSVSITDGGNFTLIPVTVARNGSLIYSQAKDISLNVIATTFEFIYSGATKGWDFTATTGPKGDEGIAAKILKVDVTSFAFAYEDGKALEATAPDLIEITATKQNIQGTPTFIAKAYDSNNVELGSVTLTGTGDTRVLTPTNFNTIVGVSDRLSIRYVKITVTLDTYTETTTIYRTDSGSDAIIHYLTNESHPLSADSFGVVSTYSGASTKGYVIRGLINETMDWSINKSDSTGLTTTLVTPTKISTTGTIQNIIGTGPWTATISNMTSTVGLNIGDEISAVENSTGKLYGGIPTSVLVTSKTSTSITYTVTGGTTPIAGTIGGLAKGKNEYTLTVINLNNSTDSAITTIVAEKDGQLYEKIFSITKSKDGTVPVVIDLSNDNTNVATDSSGNNGDYSLAITDVNLYVGSLNALPLVTNLVLTPSTGVSFNYLINGTTLLTSTTAVTLPLSPTINTLNIGITDLTSVDNGKVTVAATYDSVVYTTEFTVSKTRGGAGGAPAVVYSIEPDSEIIYNPNTGLFSPTTVIYTAYIKTGNTLKVPYQNSNGSIRLEYSTNNVAWTTIGVDQTLTSTDSRSLTTSILPQTAKFLRASLIISGQTVDVEKDSITEDGTNSSVITVDVENDTHQIPFTASGTATYTYSGTKIQVFDNTTELQYVIGPTVTAGQWTLTNVSANSITASASVGQTATVGQKYLLIPQHSALVADTASITYTIKAISTKGVEVTGLLANQTFTKVLRTGVYRIVGATPIIKSKTGTFNSVTVSGQLVDGNTITPNFGYLTQTPNGGSESSRSAGNIAIQPTSGSTTTSVLVKLYETSNSVTVLDQAEIKVANDGQDGSAFTIDVINDSHSIPCNSDGTAISYLYTGSIIQVFENTTELQYVAPTATLTAGQWKITSATGTGIVAAAIPTSAVSGQKYVQFPDHSNITTETAKIDYVIQAMTSSGITVSGLTSNQTFTKLRQSALFRIINATPIRVNNAGSVTQTIINAQKITGETITTPFGWITEQLDSGSTSARVQLTSGGYTTNATSTNQQVTIRLYETNTSTQVLDTAQLKIITDGLDAKTLTVDIENDTHQIPFTATGTATYTLSGTKIQVFENITELQYVSGTPSAGQWTITATTASNITSSVNSTASNKPAQVVSQKWATIPDHSNLSGNTASITYTIQAKTLAGVTVNGLVGNQTFTKVQRTGIWRIVGAAPIAIDSNGTVNNLTLSGQLVDGTTILSSQGWLTQQVMPGGTESARVASLTTSAISSSTHVIVKLYDASSGGNLVDQNELRVVTSGTSGQSVDVVFTRIAAGSTPTITSTANPPSGNSTWTTSVPAGSNPLWSSTGYSNAPYTTWSWDTPVRLTGETVVELSVYTRSSSASVTTPSGGVYNFVSKTITTLPTSSGVTWYDNVPAGTDPVWESRAVITDTNTSPTWTAPVRVSMSARGLDISGIVGVKYNPNTGTKYTPSTVSLTAVTSNLIGTVSYSWTTSSPGVSISNSTTSTATLTFSGTDLSSKIITLTATDSIGSLSKTLTIPIVESASQTIFIDYTNDSHSVPVQGTTANWTGSGGEIKVYEGQALLTLNSNTLSASYPSAYGRYNLSITRISGDILTVGGISGSGTTTTTLNSWGNTLTQQTIYRITAYVTTTGGSNIIVSTDATITPVKDGVTYRLSTSASSLAKNINSSPVTLTPNSLILSLYQLVGANAPALYSGRFIIDVTTNGSTWSNAYTSSSDQNTYTYSSIPTNIVGIRIRAYLAGGTSKLVDEETVNILSDGAAGAAAKGIDISTNGSAFKKSGSTYTPGTITLTAIPQNLTSPSYSWTVSSGATINSSTASSITLTPTTATQIIGVTLVATSNSVNYTKSLTFGIYTDGVGIDGKRTATGYVYYQAASATAPGTPGATSYQFTTATFTALTSNWNTSAPTITNPNAKYWASAYTALENSAGGNASSGANLIFGAPQQTLGFTGIISDTSTDAITTVMIKDNQLSSNITASTLGPVGIVPYNNNTTYGYLWPFNTRGVAAGPATITPTSNNSKILINWSTQYYSSQFEYNVIEVWRFINTTGSTWVTSRLYYAGSHADITVTAAQSAAYRIQGEEIASGSVIDTTFIPGKVTAYFLVVGNMANALTYVNNPYLSLTELKR